MDCVLIHTDLQDQLNVIGNKLDDVHSKQSLLLEKINFLEFMICQQSPSPASNVTTPTSSGQQETNSAPNNTPASSSKSLALFAPKKCVLPEIDKTKLISADEARMKYNRYVCKENLSRFAVKLAKEVYFGPDVMAACTMQGTRVYHPIPPKELDELKEFLYRQAVPAIFKSRTEFEGDRGGWKDCWYAIGQSCKNCRGQ